MQPSEHFALGMARAATVDGARYDIISILGNRVTLVTSRFVDTLAQVWAFTSALGTFRT